MKIRNRITLYFILITGTLLLLSFTLIYFFSEQDRSYRFNKRLQNKALTTANLLLKVDRMDSILLKSIDNNREDYLIQENIVVFDDNFEKIYDNNDTIHLSSFININNSLNKIKKNQKFYNKINTTEIIGLTYPYGNKSYFVIASAYDHYGLNYINSLRINLSLIFIIILISISIVGWRFSKRIITPIQQITSEVNLISSDNLKKRLPQNKNFDEISMLITTFNNLLDRIESGYELQKNFTSNISHELKNPLTAITTQLEIAKLKDININEYKSLIDSLLEDIQILNQITESMILLTRLNFNQNSSEFPLTRFDEFILHTIEEFKILNPQFSIKTNLINLPDEYEDLFYNINTDIMKRGILNLLDNAKKYSEDKEVRINLKFESDSFELEFLNKTSYNIPSIKINNLIEPFQRGNATKEIEGYGLGLSIVNQILKIHSFKLKINLSQNTIFGIKIYGERIN